VTVVPEGPTVGSNAKVAAPGAVNVACPVSPVVPATLTVYGPIVPDATVNDPDIAPPATAQSGLEIRPLGDEVIVQPVSPAAKLLPVMRTFVVARPEVGSNEIAGSTVKSVVPKSVPGAPVTVTVVTPGTIAAITGNEPVTTPPEIVQDAPPPTAGPARAHVKSVGLKPVPDTDIDAPTGPEAGDRVTTRGTMF
jgi:hypothetical protein